MTTDHDKALAEFLERGGTVQHGSFGEPGTRRCYQCKTVYPANSEEMTENVQICKPCHRERCRKRQTRKNAKERVG